MVVLLHCTYKEIHSNTLAATTEINTSKNALALDAPLFKIKHVHTYVLLSLNNSLYYNSYNMQKKYYLFLC